MSALIFREGFWVREDNVEQDLVVVRDVYQNDCYRTSLLGPEHFNVVVDVGAHIGTFAALWHAKNPRAKIVCVEACPENIPALEKNVGEFARVVHAACSYAEQPLGLLNAVRPDCESTGGSMVVPLAEIELAGGQPGYKYWHDRRPLPKTTLEELLALLGEDRIDLLKLDCEESEYDILEHTPSRRHIRFIVGEYHGQARWDEFRLRHFYFWDYGHMYAMADRGLFHLSNRCWPPREDSAFVTELRAIAAPGDDQLLDQSAGYYDALLAVVKRLAPSRVVEVGVLNGYSALAFFRAGAAEVIGIENGREPARGGTDGHAERILAGHNFRMTRSDSSRLSQFPGCDLVFVDADYSYDGCLSDLRKASRAAPLVLVDDFREGNPVARAVAALLDENRDWDREFLECGDHLRRLVLLRRLPGRILRVAVPSGIGDVTWVLTKLPALLAKEHAEKADIDCCHSDYPRCAEFLSRFDFIRHAGYCEFDCVERDNPVLPDGCFNYAPSQPHWHDRYDWFLQANGHLEHGRPLEDWLPELTIDWDIARRFHFPPEDEAAARQFSAETGPFVLCFAASTPANTIAGHNRGPLWTPGDWAELCRHFLRNGIRPVFVGANWDRDYYRHHLAGYLPAGVCECIDQWPIGETFSAIRLARGLVSYQSGLGIFGVYLGAKVAMWWRPHGNSIVPDRQISFSEEMARAWAPPGSEASGRYLPLIYGRQTVAQLVGLLADRGWFRE
jgi:FkbM family methyltransferase